MKGKQAKDEAVGPTPDWLLERIAAGDLPPERAEALRRRLEAEEGGGERLAGLASSNAEILAAHPPAEMARAIRGRAAAETAKGAAAGAAPARSFWVVGAPALAFATAIAAVFFLPPARPGGSVATAPIVATGGTDDGDRIKGLEPRLRIYRKVGKLGKKVELLEDGAAARPGDELQLAYVAAGRRYGAVLSLDGAGRVTFHLPVGGGAPAAVPLRAQGEVSLPASYQLDAAPRFERFLFVTSDTPFSTERLPDVIRGEAPPPAGTSAIVFTVRKEP
jgi:hypothetical protein